MFATANKVNKTHTSGVTMGFDTKRNVHPEKTKMRKFGFGGDKSSVIKDYTDHIAIYDKSRGSGHGSDNG